MSEEIAKLTASWTKDTWNDFKMYLFVMCLPLGYDYQDMQGVNGYSDQYTIKVFISKLVGSSAQAAAKTIKEYLEYRSPRWEEIIGSDKE